MSRTAFVTGGSGFVGGRLIRRLLSDGWSVRALARSPGPATIVNELGAQPASGDLADVAAMTDAARGADVAFHAAAHLGEWGPRAEFVRGNVDGTRNALQACAAGGVRRFVHVGTEAALLAGKPLIDVDESTPLRPDSKASYPATKAMAEQAVRDASREGFETVVVRPRLVWGPGDTTIVPALTESIEKGRFAWIGGGRHLTATTHVDNAVEGLMLGAERGRAGGVYFVTDGEPVEFREFITELLATQGVDVPATNIPAPVARVVTPISEGIWRALRIKREPPITRLAYWLLAQQCTIDTTRARSELGYAPIRTIDDGMAELRALHARSR
ncbi:MAG: NAD-dependent epimerase/dehydratase family protein [Solirubrobacterales bacterium]